jgi:hypothetical protein
MTFEELREKVLALSDAERIELLHWMADNYDERGEPRAQSGADESTPPLMSS